MLRKDNRGVLHYTVEFQGNDKDRIRKALQIMNNRFSSDENKQLAFDELLDQFSDQIDFDLECDGQNIENRQNRADRLNFTIAE